MKAGATVSFPVRMIFKKYYCHKCGKCLKRQKVTQVFSPGDPGYESARDLLSDCDFITPLHGSVSVSHYIFVCPTCHTTITFEEQESIAIKQKYAKSRIL